MNEKEKKQEKKAKAKPDLQSKLNDTTMLLQRVQADFENYKRRVDEEKKDLIAYSQSKSVSEILPVIDTFEVALKNSCDHEQFLKGVELIYSQFMTALSSMNVKTFEAVGKKFDPHLHEILMQEEQDVSEEKDGEIIEEFQKGYMIGDKILRTAKVKVVRAKKEKDESDKKDDKEERDTKPGDN